MPYAYSDVELWSSPEHPPAPSLLPPASSGLPVRLAQAGKTLNFALLAGEIAGVETEEARRILESLSSWPDSIAHVLYEDDLAVLVAVLGKVSRVLAGAVDAAGHPLGDAGRTLAEHPLMEQSAEGRLRSVSQHVDLADLRHDLDRLCDFLCWAVDHGLYVRIRPPGGGAD